MKILTKINRFIVIFAVQMIVLAIFVIYVLNIVFGAFTTAGGTSEGQVGVPIPRINTQDLERATEYIEGISSPPLDLK